MTRDKIYEEIDKKWNLFKMTNKEIEKCYETITGLNKNKNQSFLDLKEYILEFVLDQMIYDGDIDNILAGNILEDILKKWK